MSRSHNPAIAVVSKTTPLQDSGFKSLSWRLLRDFHHCTVTSALLTFGGLSRSYSFTKQTFKSLSWRLLRDFIKVKLNEFLKIFSNKSPRIFILYWQFRKTTNYKFGLQSFRLRSFGSLSRSFHSLNRLSNFQNSLIYQSVPNERSKWLQMPRKTPKF